MTSPDGRIKQLDAKVIIDGSYEGDFMAVADINDAYSEGDLETRPVILINPRTIT